MSIEYSSLTTTLPGLASTASPLITVSTFAVGLRYLTTPMAIAARTAIERTTLSPRKDLPDLSDIAGGDIVHRRVNPGERYEFGPDAQVAGALIRHLVLGRIQAQHAGVYRRLRVIPQIFALGQALHLGSDQVVVHFGNRPRQRRKPHLPAHVVDLVNRRIDV